MRYYDESTKFKRDSEKMELNLRNANEENFDLVTKLKTTEEYLRLKI